MIEEWIEPTEFLKRFLERRARILASIAAALRQLHATNHQMPAPRHWTISKEGGVFAPCARCKKNAGLRADGSATGLPFKMKCKGVA